MSTSPIQAAIGKIRSHGLRYSAVSVVNVVLGQSLLFGFQVAGIEPTTANVLAVCISAGPAYYLSRSWVWGKSGRSHLTKEILPFWGFALTGLVLSTLAVGWATSLSDAKIVANFANLSAFGVIWVVKFFVLDAVIFGPHQHAPVLEEGEEPGHHHHLPPAFVPPADPPGA